MPRRNYNDIGFHSNDGESCHVAASTDSRKVKIGMRDLVEEVDGSSLPIPELNIHREEIERPPRGGLPVLTVEFVMNNMQFGPGVPEEMKKLVYGEWQ